MLEVKDLAVAYGRVQAVKGITFTVEQGQIVSLLGTNGAGKTTTLRTVSGLVKPRAGQVLVDGKDVTRLSAQARVKRGLVQVPEGRRVFPQMSVLENLELGAYLRRDKGVAGDLDQVFTRFPRLADRRKQHAGTLSGGEQQMLAIGRALMSRPRILLLDEPSMGLAPLLVQEIFSIVSEINAGGTTVLLVEQNANMALQVADRGYVLETGRIVLAGTAAELTSTDEVKRAYLGG